MVERAPPEAPEKLWPADITERLDKEREEHRLYIVIHFDAGLPEQDRREQRAGHSAKPKPAYADFAECISDRAAKKQRDNR